MALLPQWTGCSAADVTSVKTEYNWSPSDSTLAALFRVTILSKISLPSLIPTTFTRLQSAISVSMKRGVLHAISSNARVHTFTQHVTTQFT